MDTLNIFFWNQLTGIGKKILESYNNPILPSESDTRIFLECIAKILCYNNHTYLSDIELKRTLKIRNAIEHSDILPLYDEDFDMFKIPISFEKEILDIHIENKELMQVVSNAFIIKNELLSSYYRSLFFMWSDKDNLNYKKKAMSIKLIHYIFELSFNIFRKALSEQPINK